MPVYQKEMPELMANAKSLQDLILGNKYKQEQAEQQKQLDIQKAQEMLPIEQQKTQQAIDLVNKTRQGLPAGSSMSAGGVSINTPDPVSQQLQMLLRQQSMDERKDARDDRDLVKLGERVDKSGIPSQMAALANLEQRTATDKAGGMLTNPDYEVKSAGPVANALPQFAKNIGESVGLMPKGAAEEAQLIQRLVNADLKALSGTAVSHHEMGRQNVEKGMSIGGDPNLIKLGIKQMQDAITEGSKNIESSTRPEVLQTFKKQGGKTRLEEFLGKPVSAPAEQPSAPMSFEEFKAARRAGKI
jgi:hypothetical protein